MASATADMTLEQQLGQLFMAGFYGTEPSPEIERLIEQDHLGGVILFARNLRDARQTLALTARLQELARAAGHRQPLLIATDQENGLVRRLGPESTSFPGNMALGAVGDERLTFEIAQATARELHALGINMNLAPVADVSNNPANPVIGARSFGEDPELVARLTAASVRGHRAGGVIPTLKHFPGHGDTATDSHLGMPVVAFDLARLKQVELVPFQSGLAAGADCVMMAHIALPLLTTSTTLPATLSPQIVRGLLRERLGFKGLVLTDCLEMRAITDTVGVAQGTTMALQAGNDVVLISHAYSRQTAGIGAARRAVTDGVLRVEAIQRAAERVLELKRRHLTWEGLPDAAAAAAASGLPVVGCQAHLALRDEAYARSTTLVRNGDGLVPLQLAPSERLLVVSPVGEAVSQAVDIPFSQTSLVAEIRERHLNTTAMVVTPPDADHAWNHELHTALGAADVVLVVTINAHLAQGQAELMQDLLQRGRRVIGMAVADPYDLLAFPRLRTYLATYDYSEPALASAVAVLFGEMEAAGRLPVSLGDRPA